MDPKKFALEIAKIQAEANLHQVDLSEVTFRDNSRETLYQDNKQGSVGLVRVMLEYIGFYLPTGLWYEIPPRPEYGMDIRNLAMWLGQVWKEIPPPPEVPVTEDATIRPAAPTALIGEEIQGRPGFYVVTEASTPIHTRLVQGTRTYQVVSPDWAQTSFRPGREVVAQAL